MKKELQDKVMELGGIVNALPSGEAKAALSKLVNNLDLVAGKTLLDDGTTNSNINSMIPLNALSSRMLADGDGHAIVCC